ncbi:DUF1992 domain-containing protein [Halobacillus litoralis]|uniref:DUF1992 domain-containing protein n=1 Tax=Halobacillus litoralis TaxID=45668 RepID=A0A845DYC6_9BACI|nr:DUF1992 domain-containing protein [Halobacillus litoralis]MYL21312.1 DUF1992 domain-containing protein [Halobacillus litoralis]
MDYAHLVEEKIKQALKEGDFDHLPGRGKPLPKDEFAHLPEEVRNSYRILKNANMLPEEMVLKKEISELEDILAEVKDPQLSAHYKKRITEKQLRFDILMEKRKGSGSPAFQQYQRKIDNKLGF